MHFDGRKQAAKGLPSIAADVRRMTTHSISSIRALGLRTMCSTWASCAGELNSSITSTSLFESSTCTMAMRMAMAIPYSIRSTPFRVQVRGVPEASRDARPEGRVGAPARDARHVAARRPALVPAVRSRHGVRRDAARAAARGTRARRPLLRLLALGRGIESNTFLFCSPPTRVPHSPPLMFECIETAVNCADRAARDRQSGVGALVHLAVGRLDGAGPRVRPPLHQQVGLPARRGHRLVQNQQTLGGARTRARQQAAARSRRCVPEDKGSSTNSRFA